MDEAPHLMIVAGEVSGDMHAASLVRELKRLQPGLRLTGIGGPALAAHGMTLHYHIRDMAVLGLWEVLKRYLFFRRVFRDMIRRAEHDRPHAVLLVDYPGFNLRLARELHRRRIKILYYVCPQVWAWHRSRIPAMAATLNRLLVIFPFEVDVFKDTSLPVDYVGHPLVDEIRHTLATPPAPLPQPQHPPAPPPPGSPPPENRRLPPP
ncbi:MAG TPA: lipid-A-disaccharide synthase, partial [Kiritimatiellia bacterium]|nr:lipid-A-disaccharide synthase [Kiritimatiellia bacterium]